jgi:hypothetical protein
MAGDDQPGGAPTLRASDAERERIATLLREHTAAGRLTPEELSERLEAAYEARTVGELDALAADLPAAADAPTPPSAARPPAHDRLLHIAGLAVLASAICVAVWLATGADGSFWPKWVLLACGIRVAVAAWTELGPGASAAQRETRQGRGGARPPTER